MQDGDEISYHVQDVITGKDVNNDDSAWIMVKENQVSWESFSLLPPLFVRSVTGQFSGKVYCFRGEVSPQSFPPQ